MYTKQCLTHSNTYCGQDDTFGDGESIVCEADDIEDEWGRVEDTDTKTSAESCKQKSIAEMKKVPQNLHS